MTSFYESLTLLVALLGDTSFIHAYYDWGRNEVAALVYDADTRTCYQRGDIVEAFHIMQAELARVAEERDRLKWGDRQVEKWKRERLKDERGRWR